MGGFNAIMGMHEKIGLALPRISFTEFWNVGDRCDLIQLDAKGLFFTCARWDFRSYVHCKLDRVFVNKEGSDF